MRALVPCIVDSCQKCEQLTQSFEIPFPEMPLGIEGCEKRIRIGTVLRIRQCGELEVEEINTEADECKRATTVLLSVPIAFLQCDGCAMVPFCRVMVTDVKTFALCATDCSHFELLGSDIQSLTAVVTGVCGECIRVTVSMLVRVYVAQSVEKEVMLPVLCNVKVGECGNGCLDSLQVEANNVRHRGFSTRFNGRE